MIKIEEAKKLVERHVANELPRLKKLEGYYNLEHKIKDKELRDNEIEPSIVINNFPKYISTITTGYFAGNEITYVSNDDIEKLIEINNFNFESSHNSDLALAASIYGVAYELIYIDENGKFNFAEVNPKSVIIIEDGKIKPTVTDAITIDERITIDDKKQITLTIYDALEVSSYKAIIDKSAALENANFVFEESYKHNIGSCPIIQYKNNKYMKGDFEDVIYLIDAYNDATSTSIDDLKDFTDAYLVMTNVSINSDEEDQNIKKSKILMFDDNGDAKWLVKNVNDTYSENIKNRIVKDIHKFSFTPDLSDESFFAGQQSGVAIRFKFQSLEQLRQEKERNFHKGLYKRLTLINTYLAKYNSTIDMNALEIQFQINLPSNNSEIASVVSSLRDLVSDRTLLSQIPFIHNVENEIKVLEEEQSKKNDLYKSDVFFNDLKEKEEV